MKGKADADVLVAGAGFAGLSTAYNLVRRGARKVWVVEREARLGGHASGHNAGMIRQTVADPVLAELARDGRRFLFQAAREGWPIDLRANGSLLLGSGPSGKAELHRIRETAEGARIPTRWLSPEESIRKVPVLRQASFEEALFCPGDASLDIQKFLATLLGRLRQAGVRVFLGDPIVGIRRVSGGFRVQTGKRVLFCRKFVNAAGAWAGELGRMAGASRVPLTAYRRHLFHAGASKAYDARWPFVWDLTHSVYFRPYGPGLLLSPCDKKPFQPVFRGGKTPAEKIDLKMRRLLEGKLSRYVPGLGRVRLRSPKAGLRTMASDGRFVVGEDPRVKGFFWIAGLGGHGVTTSLSVGKLASDLILKKRVAPALARALSPRRFL